MHWGFGPNIREGYLYIWVAKEQIETREVRLYRFAVVLNQHFYEAIISYDLEKLTKCYNKRSILYDLAVETYYQLTNYLLIRPEAYYVH